METYQITIKGLSPEQVDAIRELLTAKQDFTMIIRNESQAVA